MNNVILEKNYKPDLELVRIFAVICIIVNHTCKFEYPKTSVPGYLGEAWFILSRIGVPLFLMVSGAVLIPKEEGLRSIFRRLTRIFTILVLFAFGYYILDVISFNSVQSVKESLAGLSPDVWKQFLIGFVGDYFSNTPLWYLYMYMGMLLCLPFLRIMFRNIDTKLCVYYLIVSMLIIVISPLIERWMGVGLNMYFRLPVFFSVGGYLLFGHYFYNVRSHEITGKVMSICIVGFIMTLAMSTYVAIYVPGTESIITGSYFINLTVMAMLLFVIICGKTGIDPASTSGKIMIYMGRCTFGIFLFERMVRNKFDDWQLYEKMCEMGMPSFLSTLIFQLIVFMISWVLTIIVKQIPGLKRLL